MTEDRRPKRLLLAVVVAMASADAAMAQARASERATLKQVINGDTITIDYFRPSLRGRDSIFGGQVEWGHVWTPGANRATTLRVTRPTRIENVPVAPGTYAMWIAVRRDSAWTLYLHPDTTKWHLPSPPLSEMAMTIPLPAPSVAASRRETLAWDFEHIRSGGAQLQMHWGTTLLSFAITVVDAPVSTVDAAIGRRYEGDWLDISARDTTRRRDVVLRYDAATRQLLYSNSADLTNDEPGARWGRVLMPRSEDIFLLAYTINGELAQMTIGDQQLFIEFTTTNGVATSYVRRNSQDVITSRGVRKP